MLNPLATFLDLYTIFLSKPERLNSVGIKLPDKFTLRDSYEKSASLGSFLNLRHVKFALLCLAYFLYIYLMGTVNKPASYFCFVFSVVFPFLISFRFKLMNSSNLTFGRLPDSLSFMDHPCMVTICLSVVISLIIIGFLSCASLLFQLFLVSLVLGAKFIFKLFDFSIYGGIGTLVLVALAVFFLRAILKRVENIIFIVLFAGDSSILLIGFWYVAFGKPAEILELRKAITMMDSSKLMTLMSLFLTWLALFATSLFIQLGVIKLFKTQK